MKYSVNISRDRSNRSVICFSVEAHSYLGAMISALDELTKQQVPEHHIDKITISVDVFMK